MTAGTIAILGPTASGKSAVALAVATSEVGRRLGIELISVDAMQVYRGMDLGTAKPNAAERTLVAHHMLDLVDACEIFTVAQFQTAFRSAVVDIESRGGRPLLVGGTGLYLRAVVDDLDIPGTWPDIRDRLAAEATEAGSSALFERLRSADPKAASRMEPSNTRRIIRALEVIEGSGRRFSSFGPGVDEYPASSVQQVALRWEREVLRSRIARRVQQMVENGLLEEVRRLLDEGMSITARQALGYRELIEHLEGRLSFDDAVESIVVHTCQFAVRQERWFRRDPRVTWFEVREDPVAEVAPRIIEMLT